MSYKLCLAAILLVVTLPFVFSGSETPVEQPMEVTPVVVQPQPSVPPETVIKPQLPTPAPVYYEYEVTSFSVDSLRRLSIEVKDVHGRAASAAITKGTEGDAAHVQYFVKFPDNTKLTLSPSYNIDALHTDQAFASGGGSIEDGKILEFKPGETVIFGSHGGIETSCTIWVRVDPIDEGFISGNFGNVKRWLFQNGDTALGAEVTAKGDIDFRPYREAGWVMHTPRVQDGETGDTSARKGETVSIYIPRPQAFQVK